MIYGQVDAPRRFTATDLFTDEEGNPNDELPESRTSFEFAEVNGETIVSNLTRYASEEARDQAIEMGVEAGIVSTFARLDKYLASLD